MFSDDEPNFSESLQLALDDTFSFSVFNTIQKAREFFKDNIPDAVLIDLRLPDGEGTELLDDLKCLNPIDIEKLKRELNIYLENKLLHKKRP